ncbi:uncharacterized protein [Procambarus clarkii]|uniref:uncharacterized protein n=1 Tax=Procambarus clarkii TaxID=6728 RepID=UPI001E674B4F|nr:uncharacterized protein LOC123774717 [Procambarus clarkii]XP_045625198.1 uncharacterized protein LOC123774717 [Procambarus clarkii]XP_045625199.1 uncharacterized protein LOC123774717 [Procambarus clarkii]XP_045625200.1 uncharacterized protein LOC123774717 [Procambarus clarkii]
MFQRMFGRRRSPVTVQSPADPGIEAAEEKAEIVNSDGFIVVDNTSISSIYDPPPGYTVGGANAFLPYGIDPKASESSLQRSTSVEVQSAIDGIPFKLGPKVLLEGHVQSHDISFVTHMLSKINSFNLDDYEYNFELERSILQEFNSTEQAG